MAAQLDIPLAWTPGDPEAMKRDLERLCASLAAYASQLTGHQFAAVVQRRLVKRRLNDPVAAFGEMTIVSLPGTSDVLDVALPRPDPRNAGLVCVIVRKTTTGTIHLSAPGCQVNGVDIATLVNDIGATPVWFDGENYYTPPGTTQMELG